MQTICLRLHRLSPLRSLSAFPTVSRAMSLSHESEYSSLRAYAVKLRTAARPDVLAGRFERIVTDRRRAFEASHDLLEALAGESAYGGAEPLVSRQQRRLGRRSHSP
jgi:hypothetical protein